MPISLKDYRRQKAQALPSRPSGQNDLSQSWIVCEWCAISKTTENATQ